VHDVALAASNDRAQVVIDTLARHAAEELEGAHVPLEERLERQIKAEVSGLGARVGQRRDQRVDATLAPGNPRPARHLGPIQLQHLTGPIAGALGGTSRGRAQPTQVLAHEPLRAAVAVLVTQDLGHSRRLDLRPLLDQPTQHRLERVELRTDRSPPVPRRLLAARETNHRAPIDPQPPRDLPLREPLRRQRPHLRPLQRAPHLLPPRSKP
jgi:hypothetical protein